MRTSKYTQCVLCLGKDLAESVRIFNAEMKRLSKDNPTFEKIDGGFLIYYTITERVPESVAEEKELQGIRHHCIECNHCERPLNRFGQPDGRRKKVICQRTGRLVGFHTDVCDIFYEEHQDFQEFKPVSIERVIARSGTDINEEVGA